MNTQRRLRWLDLAIVTVSAPLWIPALAGISAAVLVSSGRPILFVQERVGLDAKTFPMRKFRSMTNGDNPVIPDPDTITPIGSRLRRTSLDELPQILNVIDGSMSLVGPRPILPAQLERLSTEQRRRLSVLPGLTGLAQVNGRNSLSWDQRFEFDLKWALGPSVLGYLSILFRTVKTVLTGQGVDGHDPADRLLITSVTSKNSPADSPEDGSIDLRAQPRLEDERRAA